MVRLAVHGSATRSVAPERGAVHLSVNVVGDSRATVMQAAQRAHAAVVALARRHVDDGAATGWTAPDVQAWAFTDWAPLPADRGGAPGQQEQITRYRAGGDLHVTFTRLDALSDLVAHAALLDDVDVQRVDWTLTDATREALVREVRVEAARDAVARGADYAGALDLGAVSLVALYEAGLHPGLGVQDVGPSPRILAKAAALEVGGFDLRPHDIDVTVDLTAELDTVR
ncbi:SIMPL domain-containing protein [Xylanimonas ulmi]|uniref:SIMPL domain-containing protein n=1 Tax=Xylanimonas ulmi TaxID=228973 RepID=A0A4Q7M0X9_9MICO|nr:SIMPL domain-containing protein [Xylanibacterium ulmi]RZS61446.1 hypothetical protein EV386_1745 [Xylanibacterium ulmi]